VFLKSEGFVADQDLSKRFHQTFFRLQEDLQASGILTERDDALSLTVRDLRQLSRAAGAAL
jgi:hypothetical protein